ncbi:MAG: hypothetical protein V1660_03145 [archaeon]
MERVYFNKALKDATEQERSELLRLLEDPKAEHIRKSVEMNALSIEDKNYKIAFYNRNDINDAIKYLNESSIKFLSHCLI